VIRKAVLADLDQLVALEQRAFQTDQFSRRTFRYLLTRANAISLVYELDDRVVGYCVLLFHTGTSLARVYSLAVDPDYQGRGIARELMEAVEAHAIEHSCVALRLEVRVDGAAAINLYERLGYKKIGKVEDYYEDGQAAYRYEKRLNSYLKPAYAKVPYYGQMLEFTCGPAVLMMAMHALDKDLELNRSLELRLWRESTTIFMAAGHGGCGPYGLALAACRRGFAVEIYVNDTGTLFIDSVRSEDKKHVLELVQDDFLAELQQYNAKIVQGTLNSKELEQKFNKNGIPLVLISSYRLCGEKSPHWVVVTGFDEQYIYVHDPYVDRDQDKSEIDMMNMPIAKTDFERMARFGKSALKAVVIIKKQEEH
jgi:ribosomal-protein-alanine acetyltransferase